MNSMLYSIFDVALGSSIGKVSMYFCKKITLFPTLSFVGKKIKKKTKNTLAIFLMLEHTVVYRK